MYKTLRLFLFLVVASSTAGAGFMSAQDKGVTQQADELDWNGKYADEKNLLQAALPRAATPAARAELYWRLSRATLNLGDAGLRTRALTSGQAIKVYEEGEAAADRAIRLNPALAGGYFWKAANMGRWGQTRGVLDSLSKAGAMQDNLRLALTCKPDMAEAFYILGELYEKLPGWPLSFGNVDYSVSLGRRSVAFMERQAASGEQPGRYYIDYVGLAGHLWARNWDATRRERARPDKLRQYNARTDYLEKQFFYEGTLTLPNLSDRDEARAILKTAIAELEAMPRRTVPQEADLQAARDRLATFR